MGRGKQLFSICSCGSGKTRWNVEHASGGVRESGNGEERGVWGRRKMAGKGVLAIDLCGRDRRKK